MPRRLVTAWRREHHGHWDETFPQTPTGACDTLQGDSHDLDHTFRR